MKKIILLGLTMIFMSSCSDSENAVDLKPANNAYRTAKEDLQTEYLAMIDSQSYKDYEAVASKFHSNINEEDDYNFIDKNTMLSWISSNMSQTTFKDFQDAADQWNVVETKIGIAIADNETFFSAYSKAKPETLIGIVPFPFDGDESTTLSTCEEKCIDALFDCVNSVVKKLNEELAKLDNISHTDSSFGFQADKVFSSYKKAMGNCNGKKSLCLNNCAKTGAN